MGLAIFKDHELLEWKVKTVNGKWNDRKLTKVLHYVSKIIGHYRSDTMVVKILHNSRSSHGLNALVHSLQLLAKQRSLAFYTCTINDLKDLYEDYNVRNKQELMHAVVLRHPELMFARDKELKNRNRYYTKMFEAVACAHSCLKKQSR